MRTKEVENAIKEGKDYIEFMTTAGDNAEWAKTVLSYIEELEQLPNKIRDKITECYYEYEKAKRKNDNDRADFYFDLMNHFRKLLGE